VFSDLYLDNSITKLWLCLGGMPLTANNRTRSVGNMDVSSESSNLDWIGVDSKSIRFVRLLLRETKYCRFTISCPIVVLVTLKGVFAGLIWEIGNLENQFFNPSSINNIYHNQIIIGMERGYIVLIYLNLILRFKILY
jgi:hypothetical protein